MKTKKEYDIAIGETIRKLRKSKKLSQEALGDKIGVERSTIAKYESGSNPIDMSVFLQICEVLGADPAETLGAI